jgi:SAM-dependent methyltransferase
MGMKVDYESHYSEDYFYPNHKTWHDHLGRERKYFGPAREWAGFGEIAAWMKNEYPSVNTILDVGCSAGSFVDHATRLGFDCNGVDVSRYALKTCVQGAKGRLRYTDISRDEPSGKYDMVTAMDLMEHIYQKDLNKAISYMINSIKPGGHLFLCIATARHPNEIWSHTSPEDEVPADKNWLAVAGHVHIEFFDYWLNLFQAHGIKIDYERMCKFQLWRSRSGLKDLDSWDLYHVLIGKL